MKIIIFDKYLGYQVGGAQKSFHFLIENFKKDFPKNDFILLGCENEKSFSSKRLKIGDWNAERIKIKECPRFPYFEYWFNRKKISEFIKKQEGDIIITQGLWGAIAVNNFKGKKVYFIRDEYQLNKIENYHQGIKRILKKIYLLIQKPFIKRMFEDNKSAIEKSDIVVSNSKFIYEKIKEIFNRDSEIIYPVIDVRKLLEYNLPDNREYIVSIGSEIIKGRKIMEKIDKEMPNYKFMIVGREFDKPIQKNNILYYPWQKDVLNVYNKARIVLVPSVLEEAFGRVAVESMALSIPCLGSDRGGIKEALNDDFIIKDLENIQEWKEKILWIEKNYFNLFNKLKENALKFDSQKQIEKFEEIMKNKFSLEI
jgi:glycosyltransferase involved in cell wall biosynthesis